MPRIKVIPYSEASDDLKKIYDDLIRKRGKLADIHTVQSLNPDSIVAHMDLYILLMYSSSELSRAEREMIGTVTSVVNRCRYCTLHHSAALNHFWKNDDRLNALVAGKYSDILNARELALVEFACKLTRQPADFELADPTPHMRSVGLSDSAILDAAMITAYFNFVNRIVLSLGVNVDNEEYDGYNY